ncbi:MAG: peptidoglycan-binding protein [Clostridia bacterium]|nr:peptidoglycan-binding protein [Clostridia bacterium]MDQ7791528.1 peptidoglycan-binding protein [Clostridia bacterium]
MWRLVAFLLLIAAFSAAPPSADAASPYVVCPINCEENRLLYPSSTNIQTGDDIRELQEELSQAGFYKGPITSAYDPETAEAVRQFQNAYHIRADAVVGIETWQTLAELVEPVKTSELPLPPTGEVVMVIDVRKRTLTVLNDGYPYHQFPVAVGKSETPSPVGQWKVLRKARNWGTGFGTRWMGLNVSWGIYGIHGTNKPGSIGSRASHGCIRMFNRNAEQLFPWVEAGTPVYIVGNIMGPHPRPVLVRGDRESGVLEIQRLMIKHGYYDGEIDGIFGGGLREAVINFRKDHGLLYDDRVDSKCYELLGL